MLVWWGWGNFDAYLTNQNLFSFGLGVLGCSAGIGLALGQRWSQYATYLSTAIVLLYWAYSWYAALSSGYSYDTKLQLFFSVLLTLVPPAVACACSYVVYKRFSANRVAN